MLTTYSHRQEITRTQRYLCWGVFILILAGLGFWFWKADAYVTVKDFVTFPSEYGTPERDLEARH